MTRQIKRTMGPVWIAGVLMTGCIQAALDEWHALTAAEPSTGVGSSSSTGTPDMDLTGGIQTVTSATSSTGPGGPVESSGGPQNENPPPVIESFSVTPKHRSEAGPAVLELLASQDVVKVQLRLGDKLLAELTPADFPYTYEVLSAKFNFVHDFEVVVEDAEGLTDAAKTTLTVNVPQTGTEKCLFTDETAMSSGITGVAYADDAIVAAGMRDTGDGPRMTVWKLDPDHCKEVLQGWPKTIANWNPALNGVMSAGTAVTLDEDRNIVVTGFTLAGLKPQRYLAMLTPDGSRLWEIQGEVGEEISGVVVAPKPKAAVLAVGWRRSGPNATPTDAMIWNYKLDGTPVPPDALVAPFTPDELPDPNNLLSEWARALVVAPGGKAIVIGEREFRGKDLEKYTRTFAVRLDPLTGLFGEPWTSPGDLFNDSAAAVAVCGSELVAAGWRRDKPLDAEQTPLLQWFAVDTSPLGLRAIPMASTRLRGVACDRERKIISAGVRGQINTDAVVFATTKEDQALVLYEAGAADDDEATAVSCDRRGFCAWGGFRTKDGRRFAVVRGHHP